MRHISRTAITLTALLAAPHLLLAGTPEARKPFDVSLEVIQVVERQLNQLAEERNREIGPERPHNAAQAAYYLLEGLAAGRREINDLTPEERSAYGMGQAPVKGERVFEINEHARVAFVEQWIQDKAGSYFIRSYTLYVLRNGVWTRAGGGSVAGAD